MDCFFAKNFYFKTFTLTILLSIIEMKSYKFFFFKFEYLSHIISKHIFSAKKKIYRELHNLKRFKQPKIIVIIFLFSLYEMKLQKFKRNSVIKHNSVNKHKKKCKHMRTKYSNN